MRNALIALALTLSAGCTPQPIASAPGELDRTGETLETVNGKPVTQGMLDALIATIPEQARAQLEEQGQIGRVQEQLITQEILYQEAINAKVHEKPDVKTMLAFAEREALIEALLRQVVEERSTDDKVQEWYEGHLVQFRNPQALISHILVDTEEEAKAVKAELDGGADFATVASTKSKDAQTAATGGEIGWLSSRELPPNLSAPLLAAEKGTVLDPQPNPGGTAWHVFKVNDKRDVVPLEEVKDQVKQRMQKEIVESYIEELTSKAAGDIEEAGAKVEAPPVGGAPAAPAAPAPAAPAAPPAGGQ